VDRISYFDKIASYYDCWYTTKIGNYVDDTEKREVSSLLTGKKGLFLDLGCGTANYTIFLNKLGQKTVGLDGSIKMIKIAIKKLPHIPFISAEAGALPFKDSSFDSVLSITLFEFLDSPKKTLREIYRILKPKGEVIIGTMNAFSAWFFFKRVKSVFTETAYRHARFYTPNELKSLFREAGFLKVNTRGVIYLPSFVPHFFIPFAQRLDHKYSASPLRHLAAFVLARGQKA
jgi:ubiquinone/menaquinone biosynthesis C-methylase UbiE